MENIELHDLKSDLHSFLCDLYQSMLDERLLKEMALEIAEINEHIESEMGITRSSAWLGNHV